MYTISFLHTCKRIKRGEVTEKPSETLSTTSMWDALTNVLVMSSTESLQALLTHPWLS